MIKHTPADFQVEEILSPELLSALHPEFSVATPFALCILRKESLATPEAVAHAARQFKMPAGSIAYGGLKDKHARTAQHVTVKLSEGADFPAKTEGRGWSLERLGFVPRAIASSDIARNAFRLTLRNLTEQACADMDEAARLLGQCGTGSPAVGCPCEDEQSGQHWQPTAGLPVPHAAELRIVNYFGAQRFGSARHGAGFLAKHLIKGDFEGALKLAIATEARKDRMSDKVFKRTLREHWGRWREALPLLRPCAERKAVERLAHSSGDFRAAFCALPYLTQQLSVYAYQSHLWNATARRLIVQRCATAGLSAEGAASSETALADKCADGVSRTPVAHGNVVLAADDEFGEMLFPAAAAIPPELASLDLPLLAHNTELVPPWKEAAEEVLREEGIAVSDLHIPGVRRPFFGEEPRALFFSAEGFSMLKPELDESDKKRRKRLVSFALPRGAYATVLLRALGQ